MLPIERAGDLEANRSCSNERTRAAYSGQSGYTSLPSGYTSLPSLEGIEVLVVDDDLDCLQIVAIMLRDRKATVQTAASASEALKLLEWYKPDVLVSDLAMPEEDGYSLISKVRAMEPESVSQVPAIALTAYVRVEDRTQALLAGFNIFIPKPIELNELVNAVASLAGSDAF